MSVVEKVSWREEVAKEFVENEIVQSELMCKAEVGRGDERWNGQ